MEKELLDCTINENDLIAKYEANSSSVKEPNDRSEEWKPI